jgi:hypothetical protein
VNLAEFARLVDAEPKWVLNVLTAIGKRPRYSLDLARKLTVTRAVARATGVPIVHAFRLAEGALREDRSAPVTIPPEAEASVLIDLPRILSSFNIRLSALRTTFAPRQRGRRRARQRDPLRTASEYGVDLTLLADNARRTPEERLRQLDAMADFASRVKRSAISK